MFDDKYLPNLIENCSTNTNENESFPRKNQELFHEQQLVVNASIDSNKLTKIEPINLTGF